MRPGSRVPPPPTPSMKRRGQRDLPAPLRFLLRSEVARNRKGREKVEFRREATSQNSGVATRASQQAPPPRLPPQAASIHGDGRAAGVGGREGGRKKLVLRGASSVARAGVSISRTVLQAAQAPGCRADAARALRLCRAVRALRSERAASQSGSRSGGQTSHAAGGGAGEAEEGDRRLQASCLLAVGAGGRAPAARLPEPLLEGWCQAPAPGGRGGLQVRRRGGWLAGQRGDLYACGAESGEQGREAGGDPRARGGRARRGEDTPRSGSLAREVTSRPKIDSLKDFQVWSRAPERR